MGRKEKKEGGKVDRLVDSTSKVGDLLAFGLQETIQGKTSLVLSQISTSVQESIC